MVHRVTPAEAAAKASKTAGAAQHRPIGRSSADHAIFRAIAVPFPSWKTCQPDERDD
jgi:hypothetical protein